MEALVEVLRWAGIAFCIVVFFRVLYLYPPTITIKQDVVKADTKDPIDASWMEEWQKEAERKRAGL